MTTQGDEQRQPSALAALEQRIATLEARGNASDAERIGELRRRYDRMVATLEGDGAIAQGGSISVAPGGIYIGGNFEGGQLVSGDKNTVGDGDVQSGGIRVGNITDSEKVKIGASVQGGSAADAVALTNAIMSGRITVGDITRSKDVNVGLRHITDPDNATLDELRQEVAALAEQLAAIRADDPLDETESEDAEEAAADLATVERELAKSEPSKGRILRKLESTTKVLTAGADAAEAGEKVGGYLIKLAPIAATLYQLAQKLLG